MAHAIVVAFLLAGAVVAKEKADLSGHWVLEQPAASPATIAHELVVSQWSECQVSPVTGQSFPFDFITIEQRFAGNEIHTNRYQIGLLGGTVGGMDANGRGSGPKDQVRHTTFATRWDGARLVIETGSYSGSSPEARPYTEQREGWSLDADRLVIVKTTRSSTSDPTTTTLTYKRR